MIKLDFENFRFFQREDFVRVNFYGYFYFDIKNEDLLKIGQYKLEEYSIEFDSTEKKTNKFYFLLDIGLTQNLKTLTGSNAIYIDENSEIPLIGNISFGLTDRGTTIVEVRPMTGCNLDCMFCSVDEGLHSKKPEIVIEKDYLVQEFNNLVEQKGCIVKAVINPQGEPLLYGPLADLIKDLKKNPKVESTHVISNGVLLTKDRIDKLKNSGLDIISISIHSMNQEKNAKISGVNYNLEHVKDMCKYLIEQNIELMLTPVLMKNNNLEDVKEVIEFAKSIGAKLGVQNYLEYKGGRNPDKQMVWKEFISLLEDWEKEYDVKLLLRDIHQFKSTECNPVEKPMKKGDIVQVEIKCPDHDKKAMIGVANNRSISVYNCSKNKGTVKVKLTRDKDNIYTGKCL